MGQIINGDDDDDDDGATSEKCIIYSSILQALQLCDKIINDFTNCVAEKLLFIYLFIHSFISNFRFILAMALACVLQILAVRRVGVYPQGRFYSGIWGRGPL